jgi:hypothetical protein
VFGRRLIIIVAVLMGLTALAASVAPPPETARRGGPSAGASPTPTPAPTGPVTGAGTVTRRIDAADLRSPVTITVPRGALLLALEVAVGRPDTVALGDASLEAAAPGSPARFDLLADTPGELPLRLLEAERPLGVVRVSAASAAR